jgi:uncharacterized protein (TIGR02118 family)
MIKVTVLYPYGKDAKFDWDYYLNQHVPLVQEKLGATLKGISIDQGLAGGPGDAPPPFVAMGNMLFDSTEEFQRAFQQVGEQLLADVPNFTPIQPSMQISDVRM